MMKFNHSGNIGDILYSLYFVKEYLDHFNEKSCSFNIQTNVQAQYTQPHVFGNVRMTENAAEMLKPLLEQFDFIDEVTISDNVPLDAKNLDDFRKLQLNLAAGNICRWYYSVVDFHLPQNFSKKLLDVMPMSGFEDKICLIRSSRYNNELLQYNTLELHAKKFIFLGTKGEHEEFCKRFFNVEYCPISNFLQAAQIITGCKGVVSNQTGMFAIAELLKVPRLLCTSENMFRMINNRKMLVPGPCNVHPTGGWTELATTTEKLESSFSNLLTATEMV